MVNSRILTDAAGQGKGLPERSGNQAMLFNSYGFIFLFLPVTFLFFFAIVRSSRGAAISWLVLASLFFYGWWNPLYLILILLSMGVNFGFGRLLGRMSKGDHARAGKLTLAAGVTLNLAVLGYFKYANFFVENLNAVAGTSIDIGSIVLPLAISFFTFQQIAYLVDAYKGITHEYRFTHYALFVTFFPQLIAGPIVHHKEMLSQFMDPDGLHPRFDNITVGLSIFFIGLFKKAVLADGVAPYSTTVFDAATSGEPVTFFVAWGGALAYTMQLYFDFSGYSDMAIGGARLFGIRLPLNFHSPYKSVSIVEFWRRWHMTLSRFLRDYLYIPLGGSRRGKLRRYINLFVTMLLGGLWHGAGWTFVIWGGLHGLYLAVNHAWHRIHPFIPGRIRLRTSIGKLLAWAITFTAVVVGWVFFRAADLNSAITVLKGMSGASGIALPNGIMARLGGTGEWLQGMGVGSYLGGGSDFVFTYLWVVPLLLIAILLPNTQEIMSRFEPALNPYPTDRNTQVGGFTWRLSWRPSPAWSLAMGLIATLGILALSSVSEFLYFQF